MTKAETWNQRVQEVLEKTYQRESRLIAKQPGGLEAVYYYGERLAAYGKKLKAREEEKGA